MGRKKKVAVEGYCDLFSEPLVEEKWDNICPLCGKKFLTTKDLCYYVDKKLVCSWKCFFEHVTEWEIERIKLKESQPQRGRRPKQLLEVAKEDDTDVL